MRLSLSAYEMAQIGMLVLNNGVYNGVRVISENYLKETSKSYVSLDHKFGNQDYGYFGGFYIKLKKSSLQLAMVAKLFI